MAALLVAPIKAFAWGHASGPVETVFVNAYGNYDTGSLQQGFCFKVKGYDSFIKIAYSDTGEKRKNLDMVQSMVLAAYLAGKPVKVTLVDWGTDPTCRINGNTVSAKWLENISLEG